MQQVVMLLARTRIVAEKGQRIVSMNQYSNSSEPVMLTILFLYCAFVLFIQDAAIQFFCRTCNSYSKHQLSHPQRARISVKSLVLQNLLYVSSKTNDT